MKRSIFEISPRVSLGPIVLGSTRQEARAAMSVAGFPLERARGATDYYCRSSVQTESGTDDRVMFVGVSHNESFTAQYRGINVFDVPAEQLFEAVANADGSGSHKFDASEYCFPNQVITLWNADEQYDPGKSGQRRVWAQVGLGNTTYVAAIAALKHDA